MMMTTGWSASRANLGVVLAATFSNVDAAAFFLIPSLSDSPVTRVIQSLHAFLR